MGADARRHAFASGQQIVELPVEHTAETHSLAPARAVALGLRGRYLVHSGRMADGIERMQESLERLAHHRYEVVTADLVSELTVSLAKQNRRSEALALVDRSIAASAGCASIQALIEWRSL